MLSRYIRFSLVLELIDHSTAFLQIPGQTIRIDAGTFITQLDKAASTTELRQIVFDALHLFIELGGCLCTFERAEQLVA